MRKKILIEVPLLLSNNQFMKKYLFLFTSIVLILIVIIWKYYLAKFLSSFHQIDEWGIYLFVVPIAYCIIQSFSKSNQSSLKIIETIFIGVLISILLSRTFELVLPKIIMVLIGAIIILILTKVSTKK